MKLPTQIMMKSIWNLYKGFQLSRVLLEDNLLEQLLLFGKIKIKFENKCDVCENAQNHIEM